MRPINEYRIVILNNYLRQKDMSLLNFIDCFPDEESCKMEFKRYFVYLTNNMDLVAEQIVLLYKNRWQVELFFKWIKQHLKVKAFWGTSENAVRIQIYSAIIAYCLVTLVGKELKLERSTYEILQIMGISLLDKTPINELLTKEDYRNVKELNYKQLSLSLF